MKKIIAFIGLPILLFSCAGEPLEDEPEVFKNVPTLKIISPNNDDQFIVGDEVKIQIEVTDSSKINNLQFFFADTLVQNITAPKSETFTISTPNGKTGFVKIYFEYEDETGKKHGDTRKIVFFSDIVPKKYKAVNQKTHPHDPTSYTQGLEFYQGKLFEGTGRNGTSILGEVDLNSGKILRKLDLEPRYFGEGITIINDTIYQITWSEKTCFVYSMNFEKIKEFAYEGEGWGLCNNGSQLIMSNGSNEIVWRNRHTFAIEKRIQVFTDQNDIAALNEMELINGLLYVNVYQEDRIVAVDTATGKVLQDIDCSAIAKDGKVPGADVLNGIAYNPLTNKIYITGKWWPKLYEVTFEEQ